MPRPPRSEKHTSGLPSQSKIVCPLFFLNDTPPPKISPLPLHAALPISEYKKVRLGWSLTKMRELLGADDPFVHGVLGKKPPAQVGAALIEGPGLGDPAVPSINAAPT